MTYPAPLVPPKVDLRSYDWFPFHHKRLRQSAFWKRASDLACRVSVDLWAEAYEQVPAASLPDDDHLLSDWAGFGRRDLAAWLAVKDEVMGAWTLCSDGRWYHPTLSEVALLAWVEKRLHLWTRECDRIRKENARRAKNELPALEMPPKPSNDPFDDGADLACSGGNTSSSSGLPMENGASNGHPAESVEDPAENALKGKGTGTGTRTLKKESCSLRSQDASASAVPKEPAGEPPPRSRPLRKHPYPDDAFDAWYRDYPHKIGRRAAEKAFAKVQKSDDVPFETLFTGRDRYVRSKPADRAWCNPATWLNEHRWLDQPASPLAATEPVTASSATDPRIDLGGGITAPHSSIRSIWSKGRWPPDWGPEPGKPGCRVPPETMTVIMRGRAA